MSNTNSPLLGQLQRKVARLTSLERIANKERKERDRIIRQLADNRTPPSTIAKAANMSQGRVSQILNEKKGR